MPNPRCVYIIRIGQSPDDRSSVRLTTVAATDDRRMASLIAKRYRRLIGGVWTKHRDLASECRRLSVMHTLTQLRWDTRNEFNACGGTHAFWDYDLWTCTIDTLPLQ